MNSLSLVVGGISGGGGGAVPTTGLPELGRPSTGLPALGRPNKDKRRNYESFRGK